MAASKVQVLICDDHTLVREALSQLLSADEGFSVVGEARDGHEAVRHALERDVDVVLMDISMPMLSGLEAARRILKAKPQVRVVMLSMHLDDDFIVQALDAGASGYILKDQPAAELLAALRAAAAGEASFSTQIRPALLAPPASGPRRKDKRALTPREREVLQLLAEGCTVRQAAEALGLSPKTVDVHKTNLMGKLDLHNRAGLVRYSVAKKLIVV